MRFEKISREQWTKDILELSGVKDPTKEQLAEINVMYDNIKIPARATEHSAGYDFYVSGDSIIYMEQSGIIASGIRWVCDKDEDKNKVLQLYPRSGIGFKTGVRLMNTVGIIDADYYNADNEGHIMIKLYNPMNLHSNPTGHLQIKSGEAIVQGIITQYYTCEEEHEVKEKRKGGMGSTNKT